MSSSSVICAPVESVGLVRPGLLDLLGQVADPRARRGVRHQFVGVLAVALAAVLAGARSFTAIGEWVADADAGVLARLGVAGVRRPCEATIRRALNRVDAQLLDAVVGAWMRTRVGELGGRRVIAVDGKTVRGARAAGNLAPHLVAALDQAAGVVLGQVQVDAKSNEIPALRTLLEGFDLVGAVVTADAMHTQDAHAKYLHRRGAHYVLIAKANRPTLVRELTALPWADVEVAATCTNTGHGRVETRTIKVVRPPRPLSFPRARQAIRLQRRRRVRGAKAQVETVYAVTDLDFDQASAAQLAQVIRGHWTIENQVHHVRDVTYDEDRSQTRAGSSAQVMATFRNVAISLHLLAGATTIAQGTRAIMRRPERIWPLIT